MANNFQVALNPILVTQGSQVIIYRPIAPGLCVGLAARARSERLLYTMHICYTHSA